MISFARIQLVSSNCTRNIVDGSYLMQIGRPLRDADQLGWLQTVRGENNTCWCDIAVRVRHSIGRSDPHHRVFDTIGFGTALKHDFSGKQTYLDNLHRYAVLICCYRWFHLFTHPLSFIFLTNQNFHSIIFSIISICTIMQTTGILFIQVIKACQLRDLDMMSIANAADLYGVMKLYAITQSLLAFDMIQYACQNVLAVIAEMLAVYSKAAFVDGMIGYRDTESNITLVVKRNILQGDI